MNWKQRYDNENRKEAIQMPLTGVGMAEIGAAAAAYGLSKIPAVKNKVNQIMDRTLGTDDGPKGELNPKTKTIRPSCEVCGKKNQIVDDVLGNGSVRRSPDHNNEYRCVQHKNTKRSNTNCTCHGWPKLQCPNTSEAEKTQISNERKPSSLESISDHHKKLHAIADAIFGDF